VKQVQPTVRFFPTHNALASEIGEKVVEDWLQKLNDHVGGNYHPLKIGESAEI
jgi:hypothetical protein